MLLEGYIKFENRIPVSSDCLGKEYPITIAGVEGLLATPRMFTGFTKKSQEKLGQLKTPEQGSIRFVDGFDWGEVYSWPSGDSAIGACKLLFKNINKVSFEKKGQKIINGLPMWHNLLMDNISYIFEKDFRGTQRATTEDDYYGSFSLFRHRSIPNNRFIPEQFKNRVIKITIDDTIKINEQIFQKILNDTSDGKGPLLPFYFLFDAERAKFEKNFRKSVLDSATAIEVCFSFLISSLLPYNKDINELVLSKHNSLRLKRELLKALNVSIPIKETDFKKDLDLVRNKVIHAGYAPMENEANTAFKIAKQTLYSLLPNNCKTQTL